MAKQSGRRASRPLSKGCYILAGKRHEKEVEAILGELLKLMCDLAAVFELMSVSLPS